MSEQPTDRNYLLDNLKFILITLVVIGHCWGAYTGQSLFFKVIVTCTYSFHMPAFVFISGYFAKSPRGPNFLKLTASLLIPYLLFFFLWQTKEYLHSKTFSIALFDPPFHLWYLLSLFFWNLLLPVLRSFRFYLLLSIVISLLIGLNTSIAHSSLFERTTSLLPFFVIGTMCTPDVLFELHKRKYLILAGLLPITILIILIVKYDAVNFSFLLWDRSYALNGLSALAGMVNRLILMLAAAGITLALIVVTPSKRLFFTAAGSRTLPIYIFHGFILPTFLARFMFWGIDPTTDILILLFPIVLTIVLSWRLLDVAYRKVMGYINKLLLYQDGDQKLRKEPF